MSFVTAYGESGMGVIDSLFGSSSVSPYADDDAAKSTLNNLEAEVKAMVEKGAAASDENAQKLRANATDLVNRVTNIVNTAVNNLNEVTGQAQKMVQDTISKVKPESK